LADDRPDDMDGIAQTYRMVRVCTRAYLPTYLVSNARVKQST
jgi:hypothetical protein